MVAGVVVTDLGIFLGLGQVLMHLCELWLGLCAVGYLGTGLGARSRAFLLAGTIHLIGVVLMPYVLGWQFLSAGLIMASSLLVFAETQWDMRPPLEDYALLSSEQRQFNKQQQQLRQQVFDF
jgi:predicted membrane protein